MEKRTRKNDVLIPNPPKPEGNSDPQKTKPQPQIAYQEVARRHYETLSSLTIQYKGGGEAADSISQAMQAADQAYRQGDLKTAINITASLTASYPNISRLQLILGKLYFENKAYEKAIASLKTVSKSPTLFASEAQWNLLLAHLARYGEDKKAYEKLLREILSDPNHFGYKKAIALQQESAGWK